MIPEFNYPLDAEDLQSGSWRQMYLAMGVDTSYENTSNFLELGKSIAQLSKEERKEIARKLNALTFLGVIDGRRENMNYWSNKLRLALKE